MNHIKNVTTEKTWCDTALNTDFYFKDIEQAVINGMHGTRIVCRDCIHNIIFYLQRNEEQQE